jgi:hypothetical protein
LRYLNRFGGGICPHEGQAPWIGIISLILAGILAGLANVAFFAFVMNEIVREVGKDDPIGGVINVPHIPSEWVEQLTSKGT